MSIICCYKDNRGETSLCTSLCTLINVVVNAIVTIWGSVVVFGAWSNWTEDVDDPVNYCNKVPMLTAFILLILRWVLLPLIACCCCCTTLCGFGVGSLGINMANAYSQ